MGSTRGGGERESRCAHRYKATRAAAGVEETDGDGRVLKFKLTEVAFFETPSRIESTRAIVPARVGGSHHGRRAEL